MDWCRRITYPCCTVCFIFNGEVMEKWHAAPRENYHPWTFSEYGIGDGASIYALCMLRGD